MQHKIVRNSSDYDAETKEGEDEHYHFAVVKSHSFEKMLGLQRYSI